MLSTYESAADATESDGTGYDFARRKKLKAKVARELLLKLRKQQQEEAVFAREKDVAQLGAQLTEGHHAIRQEVRQMQEAMLEMTHTLEALSGGACASAVSRASVGSR